MSEISNGYNDAIAAVANAAGADTTLDSAFGGLGVTLGTMTAELNDWLNNQYQLIQEGKTNEFGFSSPGDTGTKVSNTQVEETQGYLSQAQAMGNAVTSNLNNGVTENQQVLSSVPQSESQVLTSGNTIATLGQLVANWIENYGG